jgi:hypothetical protein
MMTGDNRTLLHPSHSYQCPVWAHCKSYDSVVNVHLQCAPSAAWGRFSNGEVWGAERAGETGDR